MSLWISYIRHGYGRAKKKRNLPKNCSALNVSYEKKNVNKCDFVENGVNRRSERMNDGFNNSLKDVYTL